MVSHGFIVPLIGGQVLGQEKAFHSRPEFLLSYEPFKSNDSHLVNYYEDVPYYLLDDSVPNVKSVDVIGTTCPCAGLSTLSSFASSDSLTNEWMYKTAEFILGTVKPQVFWGENSPQFAGKMGKPVVDKLLSIAKANGYVMSIYRTKSLLHGLPQIRERSFYFFWRGNKIPLLSYFDRPLEPIEGLLDEASKINSQQDLTNERIPSKHDALYRYVLEKVEKGITHSEFYGIIDHTTNPMDWLEAKGHTYDKVGEWCREQGEERTAKRCDRIFKKLNEGGAIMRRQTTIPKDYIGAFVGYMTTALTHYQQDRYLTVRECMSIMGLPSNFELLNPKKNLNHVCQNVPVGTATDMAKEILAALNGERDTVEAYLLKQSNHKQNYEILDYERSTIMEFAHK